MTEEEKWQQIRDERDRLLRESDWTQVRDIPDSIDTWSWQLYRHHLRTLPEKYENADDVVFPAPPPATQENPFFRQ